MKCLVFLTGALIGFTNLLLANVITVSNRTNSPGQFTSIQAAINSASAGDTILVMGSPVTYFEENFSINVNKKLALFGQGYAPQKEAPFPSSIQTMVITEEGKGSVVMGFLIEVLEVQPADANVLIARNYIRTGLMVRSGCIIRENYLNGISRFWGESFSNITVRNNILSGQSDTGPNATNVLFINNLFWGRWVGQGDYSGAYVLRGTGMIISNNIFYYKSEETGSIYIDPEATFSQVNNNLYYNTNSPNPLSVGIGSITGSGNIKADPKFVNFILRTEYTTGDDFRLQPGSPAKNAGTDGLDIGPYGGNTPTQFPLSGHPPIPLIQSMDLRNSVIPPNGSLQIRLKSAVVN